MNSESQSDTAEYPAGLTAQVTTPKSYSANVHVEIGSATHTGLVRNNNEDCYFVGRMERTLQALATNLPPGYGPDHFSEVAYGMLVADGMGGTRGGEVASRMAVATFVNLVLHTPDQILRVGNDEVDRVMDRIAERYKRVGAALAERAAEDSALAQMGTTLTLACTSGENLFVGHVGDSRAYLLRGRDLVQLTRDHTYAQEMVDTGRISQQEAERHYLRHVLSRVLGPKEAVSDADVFRLTLRDGDQLLVCTDGLTGMVNEFAIPGIIADRPVQEASNALVESALAMGGKDNVTVILARYRFPP
jgi:serine/threonine protein phosphatase PrpC